MTQRLARFSLMAGNFFVGIAIIAPAGMLNELARGLDVTVQDAGLLVTYGAAVLCFGSPIVSWLTSRIDRRSLLGATLAIISLGHLISALLPGYAAVLCVRLIMLVFAAIYTPQAASTAALIMPEKDRSGAISFVFLGWSLAFALGLPLITFLASTLGYRLAFAAIGTSGLASIAMLWPALPRGLRGPPLSLKSFGEIAHHKTTLFILLVSFLSTAGQLTVFIYIAPLLDVLTGAGAAVTSLFFVVFGFASLAGNIAAARMVPLLGARRTFGLSLVLVIAGITIWTLGAGSLIVMGIGVAIWGLGFASGNSMQQARLNAAAPHLASASIALNTSLIYVGQAAGSALGGWMFAHGQARAVGYAALAFTVGAAAVLALNKPQKVYGPPHT